MQIKLTYRTAESRIIIEWLSAIPPTRQILAHDCDWTNHPSQTWEKPEDEIRNRGIVRMGFRKRKRKLLDWSGVVQRGLIH